jgi:hypothetical protein
MESFSTSLDQKLLYNTESGAQKALVSLTQLRDLEPPRPVINTKTLSRSWQVVKLLSKPKLNQQLNSTEFEVRIHSYIIIHPTPHKLSVVVVNCPAG